MSSTPRPHPVPAPCAAPRPECAGPALVSEAGRTERVRGRGRLARLAGRIGDAVRAAHAQAVPF